MLRKQNKKREESENFSIQEGPVSFLPDEIIAHILSFLPENESRKKIRLVSPRFYELINTYLLDTLYDRSLRFNKWQEKQINELKHNTHAFTSRYKNTLFNDPNHRLANEIGINPELGAFLLVEACVACFFALGVYVVVSRYQKAFSVITDPSHHGEEIAWSLLWFFWSIANGTTFGLLAKQALAPVFANLQNDNTQRQALLVTSDDLLEFLQLLGVNPLLMCHVTVATDRPEVGVTSVSHLLAFAEARKSFIYRQCLAIISKVRHGLILKSFCRIRMSFSSKKNIHSCQFIPSLLPRYGRKMRIIREGNRYFLLSKIG